LNLATQKPFDSFGRRVAMVLLVFNLARVQIQTDKPDVCHQIPKLFGSAIDHVFGASSGLPQYGQNFSGVSMMEPRKYCPSSASIAG
jgi:hypothetical protein